MHARLGAAGEHRVGVAAADDLRRLADGVRAGRARGDRRVVRAAVAERDRELPARRVGEHARDERRRHARRGRARAECRAAPSSRGSRRSRCRRGCRRGPGRTRRRARRRRPPRAPRRARAARCARASAPPSARRPRVGSKSFTSAAIRTGNSLGSKARMKSTPLSPASAARHVARASFPIGVTAPSPVTTTRLISTSLDARHRDGLRRSPVKRT